MDTSWTLLTAFVFILVIGYFYIKRTYDYWERKKVPQLKPLPFVGNLLKVLTFKKSINDIYNEAYNKFLNEKVVGIYELFTPVLIVRDTKLIENIMTKDFPYFLNHSNVGEESGLLDSVLFQMKDKKWKVVRSKITPAFSSGKLKMMFIHMLECTEELIKCINENINKDYEIKNDLSTFSINVIGNAILGIQLMNKQATAKLRKMSTSLFEITPLRFLASFIVLNAPKFSKLFGLTVISAEVTQYFEGLIKNTFEQRTKNNYQRNDYVQQLLKLKEQGFIDIQTNEVEDEYLQLNSKPATENIEITDELLTGQAFQFIAAGHDFIYLNILYSMFEIARVNHIQERLRKDVRDALKKCGGYTYEALKEMTYLEQCIQETLRLHTPSFFVTRECTKTYVTEDGLVIEKGQKLIIPLTAIHRDPKLHAEPEVFNPDRLPPNTTRSNFTYMPFGDGPRICVGMRYSLLEMKLALAKIIDNFKFTLSPQTKVPFEINKMSFIVYPKSKIYFNMIPV
ncbi:cytochrome P450 6a2-like [Rhodnius prolixus]|uniref:cytochrome P450 6a2-like n=1 Tax=Rhodnius prolixus TaxID=13249 RepID=UPI003D18CCC3